jgi:hypothetical protein
VDLRSALLRRTVPRVFIVTVVGGRPARLAVERLLRLRSWAVALSPAEANLLVLCGPEEHGLADVVERIWDQIPGPRARVEITDADTVEASLDDAVRMLHDPVLQRHDASTRDLRRTRGPTVDHMDHSGHQTTRYGAHDTGGHDAHAAQARSGPNAEDRGHDANSEHGGDGQHAEHAEPGGHRMEMHGDHAGHEIDEGGSFDRGAEDGDAGHETTRHHAPAEHAMTGRGGHAGHGMTGHEGHAMGGHGGHDMAGMEMPAGIAMAGRGVDRDGLTLDQLHVWLGPALPDWPAGLAVRLTLQGDVVQDARVELYADGDADRSVPGPVRRLDSLQRLLSVAGWPAAALMARRLRDDIVDGKPVSPSFEGWSRRVRRSRLLRWSTDGLGVLGGDVPEELRGDATARWTRWLDLDAPARPAQVAHAAVEVLPSLLAGQELAAARLIVSSLDPDIDALVADRVLESAHGH